MSGELEGEEATPLVRDRAHLSETVQKEQWLRLLLVTSTLLLLTLAFAIVVKALSEIGHTLLLFSLGGLVAYALDPLVEYFCRTGSGHERPRWIGVLGVFGLLAVLVLGGSVLLSHEAGHQIRSLTENHAALEARGRAQIQQMDAWLQAHGLNVQLESYINHPPEDAKTWGQSLAGVVIKALERLSASLVESVIVLLIALYFLLYSREMEERLLRALPPRAQPYAVQWQADLNRILGGFVRGQLLLALVIGAAAALGCLLLGIGQWLLVGLFVVVASLIPVVGPYIGAIPAVFAALATPPHGAMTPLVRVVLVLLLFVVINEIGSKVLYPRLVGAALGLHEVWVLFVLFAGWEVGHLVGVLFAAPLSALAAATLVQLYRFWEGLPPATIAPKRGKGRTKEPANAR